LFYKDDLKYYKSISTKENPLLFFKELLVKGKYKKMVSEFIEHSEKAFLDTNSLISFELDMQQKVGRSVKLCSLLFL
jgi:hypothetical protein